MAARLTLGLRLQGNHRLRTCQAILQRRNCEPDRRGIDREQVGAGFDVVIVVYMNRRDRSRYLGRDADQIGADIGIGRVADDGEGAEISDHS